MRCFAELAVTTGGAVYLDDLSLTLNLMWNRLGSPAGSSTHSPLLPAQTVALEHCWLAARWPPQVPRGGRRPMTLMVAGMLTRLAPVVTACPGTASTNHWLHSPPRLGHRLTAAALVASLRQTGSNGTRHELGHPSFGPISVQ